MPACFSMLLSVPIGISRTGCGTVTRPGLTGCLNCLWLPTWATSYQPSSFKRCMTSRLDIRYDTHFLHTCQIGVSRNTLSSAFPRHFVEPGGKHAAGVRYYGAPGETRTPDLWFEAARPTLPNLARGVANPTESASWGKFPQPAFSFICCRLPHFLPPFSAICVTFS
jgi:hypothetical protein